MRLKILFFIIGCMAPLGVSAAELASTNYVSNVVKDKVDTRAGTSQTLSGTYTVSDTGVLYVPTPALPQ